MSERFENKYIVNRRYNKKRNVTFTVSNGVCPQIGKGTLLGNTIVETCLITQAAYPLIVSTALTAISTALQGHINVELPTGKICPISLNLLTCADSGERKSTVENQLMEGIKNHQKKRELTCKEQLIKYEILRDVHDAKTKSLKRKLLRNSGAEIEVNNLLKELVENEAKQPQRPKASRILYEDSTIEALTFGLKNDSPNAFLGSSEGGVLMNSALMSNTPMLNSIWSGDDVTVVRKTTDSYTLSGVRLTTHIMIQPQALKRFMDKSQDVVRGNGYLSRFLVCFPMPLSGGRRTSGIRYEKEFINQFNQRIEQLLEGK